MKWHVTFNYADQRYAIRHKYGLQCYRILPTNHYSRSQDTSINKDHHAPHTYIVDKKKQTIQVNCFIIAINISKLYMKTKDNPYETAS